MSVLKTFASIATRFQQGHTPLREKFYASVSALVATFLLLLATNLASDQLTFSLPVLASMGASAFLLFVVPHSPMAQPWPMLGGHLLAAAVGVTCAQTISDPALATACAVALSIFGMHWLHCLHPPSAATAMIAVLGGPQVHALGWAFCYEVVAINAGTMLLLALVLNNLIPGRRYPLLHTHHPHHAEFAKSADPRYAAINEEDVAWALGKMDGVIDITSEDLVDLYEFAIEHAQARQGRDGL